VSKRDPVRVELSINNMPGLMADLRCEIARLIRESAAHEEPRVRACLLDVADAFECGQSIQSLEEL
jgi:hypothetical protein